MENDLISRSALFEKIQPVDFLYGDDEAPAYSGMAVSAGDIESAPAILGQAAEEADELGKACLKLQRILMDENPTPVTEPEARASLIEEMADICCSMEALTQKLGINFQVNILPIIPQKAERWAERIREKLADVTDINVGDKKPIPLSAGAVKALNGDKIFVCKLRNHKECVELFYYGKIEIGITTHGVGGRDIKLPINSYGSDWIAYRCSPKEEKE